MIRWVGTSPRLEGFIYYPLLETGFGIFLMMVCWIPLAMNIRFNGFQWKNYPEWIFSLGFLLFFFWMGKTLAFQSFRATLKQGVLRIVQNLRDPEVRFEQNVTEITDIRSGTAREGREDQEIFTLQISGKECVREVYRSINSGEITSLVEALKTLKQGGT